MITQAANACMNAALVLTMAASPGKADRPKKSDVQFHVSDQPNTSKVVRSDTDAFFNYVARPNVARALADYLKFEGIIQGDPHAGNVIPLRVETEDGRFVIRMVNADFDNVGEGSFVWEFVHNVIQSRAIDTDVKTKAMLDAYLDGLDGKAITPPAQLQALLKMTNNEYKVLRDQYVAKKVDGDRLKRKRGNIEDYEGKYTLSDMQELFPDEKVLDFAHRIESVGGNTGERLWILVQESDGDLVIKELKEWQPNSLSLVRQQQPLLEWSRLIHAVLWRGLRPDTYDLVTLKDGKIFWRREKGLSLLDVPRSSDKKRNVQFRDDLLLFDANFFGLSAGSQPQGAAFAKAIRADKDKFLKVVKSVVHPYLDVAGEAVTKEKK